MNYQEATDQITDDLNAALQLAARTTEDPLQAERFFALIRRTLITCDDGDTVQLCIAVKHVTTLGSLYS